jgi:hypothetical protein
MQLERTGRSWREQEEGCNKKKDGSATKKVRQSVVTCYMNMVDLGIYFYGV